MSTLLLSRKPRRQEEPRGELWQLSKKHGHRRESIEDIAWVVRREGSTDRRGLQASYMHPWT